MEIISTLGTVFSGISLLKQLIDKDDPKAYKKLLDITNNISDNLERAKNIHNFLHNLQYGEGNNLSTIFENCNKNFSDGDRKLFKRNWKTFYKGYNKNFKKRNFDFILKSSYTDEKVLDKSEEKIVRAVKDGVDITDRINTLFPQCYNQINKINEAFLEFDKIVKDNNFPDCEKFEEFISDTDIAIFDADRLLINLIEFFNNITNYLRYKN